MVGIWGVTGSGRADVASALDDLPVDGAGSGEESRAVRDGVGVRVRAHGPTADDQPVRTAGGALVWLWGDVHGVADPSAVDGYRPRDRSGGGLASDVRAAAGLYESHGPGFAARLNGDFAAVVHEPDGTVRLITDRIGSRPVFYATTATGRLVFSSQIGSLAGCREFSPAFDLDYLCEYFSVMKAFGVRTPLVGVRKVPPASVVTVDGRAGTAEAESYWTPTYDPVDEPFGRFRDEFARIFRDVVRERTRPTGEYGLLLSGGSDSRLLLAALRDLDRDVTCYHLSNWESREDRIAARVARAAGAEFVRLRRDREYHDRLLARTPALSNFVGSFDEAFAHGFVDELSGAVDALVTGYLGDTMYGGYTLYRRECSVGPLAVTLPVEDPVGTAEEYVRRYANDGWYAGRAPAYFDHDADLLDVLNANLRVDGDGVDYHGVRYPSVRELQLCEYYPLTNQFASFNHAGLGQLAHHWSPFFDDRLIDLHLRMPVAYQLRHDVVDAALARLDPELAAIPHAGRGVPPTHQPPVAGLRGYAARLRRRLGSEPSPPYPGATQGPWMDENEVIRGTDLVERVLTERRDLIESLPFLDADAVDETYRDHLDGADNWLPLYTLVTFLETPTTARVAGNGTG